MHNSFKRKYFYFIFYCGWKVLNKYAALSVQNVLVIIWVFKWYQSLFFVSDNLQGLIIDIMCSRVGTYGNYNKYI